MIARRLRDIAPLLLLAVFAAGSASAQSPAAPTPPPGPASSAPMTALVEQLLDLFPKFEGEVLEVRARGPTLGAGAKAGVRPGLDVELFREGREIKHPRTGEVLGRAEDALGLARITQAQEGFAVATPPRGCRDQGRVTASGSRPARSASCSCPSWEACGRRWSRPRPRSWWSAWPPPVGSR